MVRILAPKAGETIYDRSLRDRRHLSPTTVSERRWLGRRNGIPREEASKASWIPALILTVSALSRIRADTQGLVRSPLNLSRIEARPDMHRPCVVPFDHPLLRSPADGREGWPEFEFGCDPAHEIGELAVGFPCLATECFRCPGLLTPQYRPETESFEQGRGDDPDGTAPEVSSFVAPAPSCVLNKSAKW